LVNCNDSVISNLNMSYTSVAIDLYLCYNNTISGNILNHNRKYGIDLFLCHNNIISGNIVNSNDYGIDLSHSDYNTISGNIVNDNVVGDGICLAADSKDNHILGNTVNNNGRNGITLYWCDNNTVSGNIANNNENSGIYLEWSNENIISGNTLLGNGKCIVEENCVGNVFENNNCGEQAILGYNILWVIGAIILISTIKLKRFYNGKAT